MRKVTLYIAMSLDGYIADARGGVDWLQEDDGGDGGPYERFLREIDTVVMGWNTYRQVVTELSPGRWAYEGLSSYVVTHRDLPPLPGIRFTQKDPCQLVRELRQGQGKGIWICGGGGVIAPLIQEDLIDEYRIFVIPILLGGGIRLFPGSDRAIPLRLTETRRENGIVELSYTRRQAQETGASR